MALCPSSSLLGAPAIQPDKQSDRQTDRPSVGRGGGLYRILLLKESLHTHESRWRKRQRTSHTVFGDGVTHRECGGGREESRKLNKYNTSSKTTQD